MKTLFKELSFLSLCQSLRLFVCLSVCLSVCPSVRPLFRCRLTITENRIFGKIVDFEL